ncbi:MAG: hypothetical protein ACP5OR_03270 [Candidatus Dormibacteria bacterium]
MSSANRKPFNTAELQPEPSAQAIVQWVLDHLDLDQLAQQFNAPKSDHPAFDDAQYVWASVRTNLLKDAQHNQLPPDSTSASTSSPQKASDTPPPVPPDDQHKTALTSFKANLVDLLTRMQRIPSPKASSAQAIQLKTQSHIPASPNLSTLRNDTTVIQDAYGQSFIPYGALVALGMPKCFVEYVAPSDPLTPHDVHELERNGTVYSPQISPEKIQRLQTIGITPDMLRNDRLRGGRLSTLEDKNRPHTYSFAPIGLIVNPGAVHVVLNGHILPVTPNEQEIEARLEAILQSKTHGATPEDLLTLSPMESDLRNLLAHRILDGTLTCRLDGNTLRYFSSTPDHFSPPSPTAFHAANLLISWSQHGIQQPDPSLSVLAEHVLARYLNTAFQALPKETSHLPSHLAALALVKATQEARLGLHPAILEGPLPDVTRTHVHLRTNFFKPTRIALNPHYSPRNLVPPTHETEGRSL